MDDNADPLHLLRNSSMPIFAKSFVDPVRALTHFLNVERMFGDNSYAVDDKSKKKSLRMLLGQGRSSGNQSTRRKRKPRPGDDKALSRETHPLDQDTLIVIRDEVEFVCEHILDNQQHFVTVVAKIAKINSRDMLNALYAIAPHLLVDHTISQHPSLQELNMTDIRIYIRGGRCELESYFARRAAAQNLSVVNIDTWMQNVVNFGGSTLSRLAGKQMPQALAVSWGLHRTSNTALEERELHEQEQRVLREFPLLLIGLFSCLQWHEQKEHVIELLTRRLL